MADKSQYFYRVLQILCWYGPRRGPIWLAPGKERSDVTWGWGLPSSRTPFKGKPLLLKPQAAATPCLGLTMFAPFGDIPVAWGELIKSFSR